MRNTFINTALEFFKDRRDLFMISGDAGLGVFDEFKVAYADRFLNMGIAEQNMLGFAAGLAMSGFKVFAYNIIPFVLYRCYEQVRNDICYQKLPVVLAGIGSGITYAPQGMTHYSVEDIGIARTLPGLTVLSPIDPIEARLAARYALNANVPVYVRLAKRGEPAIHQNENFDISLPQIIRPGSETAVLFHGSIAPEALTAYDKLSAQGIRPMLISVPLIQPLNLDAVFDLLQGFRFVISLEEHYENCGLGSILKDAYVDRAPAWKIRTMGLPWKFIHEVKTTESMRAHFKISSDDIVAEVKRFLS